MDRPHRIGKPGRLAWLLGLVWAVSCMMPVGDLARGPQAEGIVLLMFGWFGVLMGNPAWLGNIVLPVMLPLIGAERVRPRALQIGAIALIVCGAGAFFWHDLPDDSGSNLVVRWRAGFYMWVATMWGAAAVALLRTRQAG
ncbi:hypothetical protein [Sphingomonas jatrophae]|uniref:Uncharacterized protein n=1 Tax=Sphingomonas jatrophae TaxID=1166337 RepID=A0A1I6LJB2_9SPHN|nr:hypothetical protein [Sphingomonas jatrophae]SFS03539.1 hypothetical protein SAMN05192580_2807 [Sphingomonas jatrophae]